MITRIAAFAGGALIGFGAAYIALENRFGKHYAEMEAANRRAYERAGLFKDVERPEKADYGSTEKTINEGKIESIALIKGPNVFGETVSVQETEGYNPNLAAGLTAENIKNDYARLVDSIGTPTEDFVAGKVSAQGISYIEEEEFEDNNDGREKFHVTLIMDETNPIFLLDGGPMDDYVDRIGDTILVDMFAHCPPGTPPVLYVRNHRRHEDYEVVRTEP